MNKRIRKKKITQKRNASRKLILSMEEGIDKDRMLMRHVIRFGDYKFVHEVIGPECYIIMPRKIGSMLAYNMIFELLKGVKIMNNYDFEGYVTKYNVLCSDERTIIPGAFKICNNKVVPLISPDGIPFTTDKVIGYVILENRDDGVYGYGIFYNNLLAKTYQQMVEDELIKGLGIYANKLKENDKHVTFGIIQAVMLCKHPANPYAKIDVINKKEYKL